LIDYLDGLRSAGETALFSRLRLKGGERKDLSAAWTEWWGPYLREHGILGEADSGRQPAREFRHSSATAARRCGLTEEQREYIQGHSIAGKNANIAYGAGWEEIAAASFKEAFNGLDLSHIRWARWPRGC
jgi:hypothetical protein